MMTSSNLASELKEIQEVSRRLHQSVSQRSHFVGSIRPLRKTRESATAAEQLKHLILSLFADQYDEMVHQILQNPELTEIRLSHFLNGSEVGRLRAEKPIQDSLDQISVDLEKQVGLSLELNYRVEESYDPCQTIRNHYLYVTIKNF